MPSGICRGHVPYTSYSAGGCSKWTASLLLGNDIERFFSLLLSLNYTVALLGLFQPGWFKSYSVAPLKIFFLRVVLTPLLQTHTIGNEMKRCENHYIYSFSYYFSQMKEIATILIIINIRICFFFHQDNTNNRLKFSCWFKILFVFWFIESRQC